MEGVMALDERLLAILACPEDKGPLLYFEKEQFLYNPRLRLRYRIKDDIPVMLIKEAEYVGEGEHARLMELAKERGIRPNFEPRPEG
jgi:uncharacterized protein YbaR (Trm112 family)